MRPQSQERKTVRKFVMSGLFVVLALSQAAEAKKKAPVAQDVAAKAEQAKPPLDNMATGGVKPAAQENVPATDGSQYPPALYFNFQ